MTSSWETVRLGEIATIRRQSGASVEASKYVGLEHLAPAEFRITGFIPASEVSSQTTAFFAGDILFGKLRPYLRKVAIAGFDGCCTTEILVWKPSDVRLLGGYLGLLLQGNAALEQAVSTSAGSRMPRTNFKDMASLQISLPSLVEQRRIVDLIGAMDDSIEAAGQHSSSLESLHYEVLLKELENIQGPKMLLSSVFDYMIGGAWGSPPGKDDTETLALGPSAFAAGRTAVDGQLGTVRSLNSKRANARFLHEGDIILERSGGSPAQPVGRVLRMESGPDNIVPSDFMRLLRVDKTLADPAYVFWVLWSKYKSGESLQFQKFTTGIRNLNITDYLNGSSIKLPSLDKQREIAGIAELLLQAGAEAKTHISSLRAIRSELLTALLSGAHEIPESYDEVMNAD